MAFKTRYSHPAACHHALATAASRVARLDVEGQLARLSGIVVDCDGLSLLVRRGKGVAASDGRRQRSVGLAACL